MIAPNDFRPILLVRSFDPLAKSPETTYYGFNDGTVYLQKLGDDYNYERMLVKYLKTPFLRVRSSGINDQRERTRTIQ